MLYMVQKRSGWRRLRQKYYNSKIIFQKGLLAEEGWFILEHTPRNDFKDHPYFRTERKYGTTIFSIFINRPTESKAS